MPDIPTQRHAPIDPTRPDVDGYPIGNVDPDKRGRGGHPLIGRPPIGRTDVGKDRRPER